MNKNKNTESSSQKGLKKNLKFVLSSHLFITVPKFINFN